MKSGVRSLRLGTRASALARWQSGVIAQGLCRAVPGLVCAETTIVTEGDRLLDRPLPEIGGKGVFTQALERGLRAGEVDLVVHSLKDLPVEETDGLVIAAICQRADPRDVLIGSEARSIGALPPGARVGTSSSRRAAQLRAHRSDLTLLPLRGNVDTRVRKAEAGEYDAIVLAAAGVIRLGLEQAIGSYLSLEEMLPAPGQGALAVQCRADDTATLDLVRGLDEPETRAAVEAEREFLAALGGGCAVPVAAYAAVFRSDRRLQLTGRVLAPDGSRVIHVGGAAPVGESRWLGRHLAREALAAGAAGLLA